MWQEEFGCGGGNCAQELNFIVVVTRFLGKSRRFLWCFDGAVVVKCVVNVVRRQSLFWCRKMRHGFAVFFALARGWNPRGQESVLFL
jgi:hypothetical protein